MRAKRFWQASLIAWSIAAGALGAGEMQRWYMNEEWYDWHPRSNFVSSEAGVIQTEVHFVGPA